MPNSIKRALVLASVASMIDLFNRNNIKILQDLGYQVDVASNFSYGSITSQEKVNECKEELQSNEVRVYNIEYPRSPLKLIKIIKAYKATKQLVNNNYKLVHCHSPIGGLICRLAFRKTRKKGTKVIYTAHGFHFYKGAPLKNWILYYPAEKFCSRFTDVLITINKEDYEFAKKHMKAKKVEYVPGVGIDIDKFKNCKVDVAKKRKELGIPQNAFLILSVGELSKRKNHKIVLDALHELNDSNVYYAIAGHGALHDYLLDYAKKLGLERNFKLLGYRSDTNELYKCANLYIHPSIHEGLPVAVMEAIASGLFTLASNIRGCSDLLYNSQLFSNSDWRHIVILIRDIRNSNSTIDNDCRADSFDKHMVDKSLYMIYGV